MTDTKIELEHPYNKDWKFGYLVTNPENRKTLILYNSNKDRTSTQYARYLMAVKLGRYLTKVETVDHINEDKTDNRLENLQVLSRQENNRKTHCLPPVKLICPVCNRHFTKTRSELRGKLDRVRKGEISCSRRCGGIFSHNKTKNTIKA